MDELEREKMLGRLTGLSDLEAYKTVGDAIHERGGFNEVLSHSNETSTSGNTTQDPAQDSGSRSANADNLRNRKRAASPTKGSASSGKPKIDISKMSDDEIMNIDINSL